MFILAYTIWPFWQLCWDSVNGVLQQLNKTDEPLVQYSKSPLLLLIVGDGKNKKIAFTKLPLILHQKPNARTVGRVEFWFPAVVEFWFPAVLTWRAQLRRRTTRSNCRCSNMARLLCIWWLNSWVRAIRATLLFNARNTAGNI